MNENNLIKYYNKFNEDKRLTRRHGQVEFLTTMKYLNSYLKKFNNPKIIDIGAGTGRYTLFLHNKGYDVTAIELVKHNLMYIKKRNNSIKAYQGNAIKLNRFKDKSFDIVLLFGPLYHLISEEEKIKALSEAKRILKDNGYIFISYYMTDYCIIKHGFCDNFILEAINKKEINKTFDITPKSEDLYSMVRIKDINKFNKKAGLERVKIIAQDGPSDYIRPVINKMTEKEFSIYMKYHFKTCEKKELIGASSHVLDIVKKN